MEQEVLQQGTVLSKEQQVALCKAFTADEVKQDMFSISNIKSPGPHGFNSGFFKHTWGIVGDLVCSAALEFFRTGYMPQFMSSTK